MTTIPPDAPRPLPAAFDGLHELARDLRYSSALPALSLWPRLDADVWQAVHANPQRLLAQISEERLTAAAQDAELVQAVQEAVAARTAALARPPAPPNDLRGVAYFSLEYGLSAALPIYAGGLGILAGDLLKSAHDLQIPLTGVGLLYAHGYYRQVIHADGTQDEQEPVNNPEQLPVRRALLDGQPLRIFVILPGRIVALRVWRADVGSIALYLLDSDDPDNTPADRTLTQSLYGGGRETRIVQELLLAAGGWDTLAALKIPIDICHLNEGHAAFVVLCRAVRYGQVHGVSFDAALLATRPGNLFTTHTPVAAGFDRFEPALAAHYLGALADEIGEPVQTFLDMGHDPQGAQFSMAALAVRGCGQVNAVSALHGAVSRELFAPLYPRLPLAEVPVGHVTNGVHRPTWNAPSAQVLWDTSPDLDGVSDEQLWTLRGECRRTLVEFVRARFVGQVQEMGLGDAALALAQKAFGSDALTVGFARRFAAYKRPDLLLREWERLVKMLNSIRRPVQIVVAGKAPSGDDGSKDLVREMVQASLRPECFGRLVFLEDYDMTVTHALVSGADVWLNTPRRPQEACGTSGMKAVANGGLHLSSLDGWWAEAYQPDLGWALGDGHSSGGDDARDAAQLFALLEGALRDEFYTRDARGLPPQWLARMRRSMTQLTPRFSSARMVEEYIRQCYLPALPPLRARTGEGGTARVKELLAWRARVQQAWPQVHLINLHVSGQDGQGGPPRALASVFLGGLSPGDVAVQMYADASDGHPATCLPLSPDAGSAAVPGGVSAYSAALPIDRPAADFTPRIVPHHPDAQTPQEAPFITWLE